eukprot:scaffold73009_cov71-Phaeocystis_antarctica.AAC.2
MGPSSLNARFFPDERDEGCRLAGFTRPFPAGNLLHGLTVVNLTPFYPGLLYLPWFSPSRLRWASNWGSSDYKVRILPTKLQDYKLKRFHIRTVTKATSYTIRRRAGAQDTTASRVGGSSLDGSSRLSSSGGFELVSACASYCPSWW